MSESNQKKLDATGLFCPEPVFRTKIEMERMQVGEILNVLADDPAAEDDISRWVTFGTTRLQDKMASVFF